MFPDSHILTQLLLCLSPPFHSQNSEMVFSSHCFYFLTSYSSFTPFRLPPPHSTQRTLIKFTRGLPVTKSNEWFSPHFTSPLSTDLYCWKFFFLLLILFTFLPLLSMMPHHLVFTPTSLTADFSFYFAGSSTSNHPLNGPNLFSLYNCSPGISQIYTALITTSDDSQHRALLWAPNYLCDIST